MTIRYFHLDKKDAAPPVDKKDEAPPADKKDAAPLADKKDAAPPADNSVKLNCNGHPCDKCQKCHDWQFSGNQETWDWIRNFLSWKDADWDRWANEGVGKSFGKREGAVCTHSAEGGGSDGSARYLSYMFLIHFCLCDPNPAANAEQPAQGPCKMQ